MSAQNANTNANGNANANTNTTDPDTVTRVPGTNAKPPYRTFVSLAETITRKFRATERVLNFEIREEAITTELRAKQREFLDFAVDVDLWHAEVPSPMSTQRLHEQDIRRRNEALTLLRALSEKLSRMHAFIKQINRMRVWEHGGQNEPGVSAELRRRALKSVANIGPKIEALTDFADAGRGDETSDSEEESDEE